MIIKKFKYIIFILVLFNIENVLCEKLYILKYYEHSDCTGITLLYQVLLSVKDYLFQLPTYDDYYRLNCFDNFHNSSRQCYVEGHYKCIENPKHCREYYEFNKCQSGRILIYDTLDYYENDYCTCTETTRTHSIVDEEIAWEGVQIIRRNYCYRGKKLDCNPYSFVLTNCETGRVEFNADGSKKFIDPSKLNKKNATRSETLIVAYKPNDPEWYKNTVMKKRVPHKHQLYKNMVDDNQVKYIHHSNAV